LIAALIVIIVLRRRLGRAAALALTGVAMLLVTTVFNVVAPMLSGVLVNYRDSGLDAFYLYTFVWSTVGSVLWTVGLGLIIVALFVGRPDHRPDAPAPGAPPL
jgi:hypothetical protein